MLNNIAETIPLEKKRKYVWKKVKTNYFQKLFFYDTSYNQNFPLSENINEYSELNSVDYCDPPVETNLFSYVALIIAFSCLISYTADHYFVQ